MTDGTKRLLVLRKLTTALSGFIVSPEKVVIELRCKFGSISYRGTSMKRR